MTKDKAC